MIISLVQKYCVFGKNDVFIQEIGLWVDLWYIHKHGEYLLKATTKHAIKNEHSTITTLYKPRGNQQA